MKRDTNTTAVINGKHPQFNSILIDVFARLIPKSGNFNDRYKFAGELDYSTISDEAAQNPFYLLCTKGKEIDGFPN